MDYSPSLGIQVEGVKMKRSTMQPIINVTHTLEEWKTVLEVAGPGDLYAVLVEGDVQAMGELRFTVDGVIRAMGIEAAQGVRSVDSILRMSEINPPVYPSMNLPFSTGLKIEIMTYVPGTYGITVRVAYGLEATVS